MALCSRRPRCVAWQCFCVRVFWLGSASWLRICVWQQPAVAWGVSPGSVAWGAASPGLAPGTFVHACMITHMPSHTHTRARTHLLFLTHTHATHTHTHTIRTHIPYVHTFSHAHPLTRPLTQAISFPPPPPLSPPRRWHCLGFPPH